MTATVSEYASAGANSRCSLQVMVQELEQRRNSTIDFVSDTRNLRVEISAKDGVNIPFLIAHAGDASEFILEPTPISDSAIAQLGDRVSPSIPVRFLRSLIAERPGRASALLTGLLHDTASRNLVRLQSGRCRAFLSDRYAPFDHETLAYAALDVVRANGGEVVECSLTDQHMRLKFTTREIWDAIEEVRTGGDKGSWYVGGIGNQEYLGRVGARTRGELPGGPGTIHPLVTVHNSETGHGALGVRMGIVRAWCFNLATVETVVENIHLGCRLDPGIFTRETMMKDSAATMAKARDAISTAFNKDRFASIVDRCKDAQGVRVRPSQAVEFAHEQGAITEDQKAGLLDYFTSGEVETGTAWGFAQACARLAQDFEDGDQASDLEQFAGRLIADPTVLSRA